MNGKRRGFKVRTNLRCGALTVYGTPTCSWTQKQVTYLDDKKIPYTFVDCTNQGACPSNVTGYPTLLKDGEWIHGYNEV